MEKFINKLREMMNKNYKMALFVLVFTLFCFILNQNSQTLNYYLKRGTTLEYSINKNQKIDKEKIDDLLLELNLKYSYIEEEIDPNNDTYDSDGEKIEKKLLISLPYIAKENKKGLFNTVSDFVFENYPDSKLTNVKVLGNLYSKKYAAFVDFVLIFVLSFSVWGILMSLFVENNFFDKMLYAIKNFFLERKKDTIELFKETKKNGIGYFLRQVLLDNNASQDTSTGREIFNTVVFVLLAVIIIRFFVGELRWIPSESMFPTIKKLDRVYVEKLDYPKRTIKRGDILVFYPPEVKLSNSPFALLSRLTGIFCKDVAFIKRTIGMPGDKFEIKYLKDIDEYRVFINDVALNEPYTNNTNNASYEIQMSGYEGCLHPDAKYCGPFIIPEKKYFMMGDNRKNSADSRFWGFLDEDRIIGRANFMFWPISRINIMTDKYIMLNKEIKDDKKIESLFIVDRYSI